MRSLVLNVVLVFSMLPALSDAQPVDSVEKRWSRMKSGNTVYVTDASARETTGTFVEISDSALTISVQGQDREILFADLRQIEKRGDSVMNRFLIGAGIGAAMGAAMGAGPNCSDCEDQFPLGGAITVGALEFGGIGALIDYAHRSNSSRSSSLAIEASG